MNIQSCRRERTFEQDFGLAYYLVYQSIAPHLGALTVEDNVYIGRFLNMYKKEVFKALEEAGYDQPSRVLLGMVYFHLSHVFKDLNADRGYLAKVTAISGAYFVRLMVDLYLELSKEERSLLHDLDTGCFEIEWRESIVGVVAEAKVLYALQEIGLADSIVREGSVLRDLAGVDFYVRLSRDLCVAIQVKAGVASQFDRFLLIESGSDPMLDRLVRWGRKQSGACRPLVAYVNVSSSPYNLYVPGLAEELARHCIAE